MRRQQSSASAADSSSYGSLAEVRKPRHRQVFETLLSDIASGRLQPGERLPSEAELARTFSASRGTISRAMRELKSRGLLNRQRGGGTHITHSKQGKRIALFTPFTPSAGDLGFIGGQIHAHLSELAAHQGDHLRLQIIGRMSGNRLEQMMAGARALIEQGTEAVFYYSAELPAAEIHYNQLVVDKLMSAGIAVIAVDRDVVAFPDRSKLAVVTYDNQRGGYLITDHLIKQGCKRIAFIGSPFVSSAAGARLRGYREALEDNGLVVEKSLIRPATLDDIDFEFARSLMSNGKVDAVVCKMDHYAALMSRHLVAMGLAIGKDVLLAGFDDQPFAGLLTVPLTTIRFPADPFVQACYERLTAQMASPSVPLGGTTMIDVELVIRESTAGGNNAPQ
jgi:DNA-binding LacI/PurR family transcriptional regulator